MNHSIGASRMQEAVDWARAQMNLEGPVGPCLAYSMVDEQGQFVAVVVFSDISPQNLCFHFAAKPRARWFTKKFTQEVFQYAFDVLQVSRITGPIRGSNPRAQKIAEKFGFTLEGILRKSFPDGDDCVVYGFLKEEWKSHKWCDKLST